MSDNFNKRCPRGLERTPDIFCPLAVMRLRAIRTAGRELSEEEEAKLPGCPWAVNHQMANYCFFKYVSEFAADKPPSDVEIASLMCVSPETVKKIEKTALNRIRDNKVFKQLKDTFKGDSVIESSAADDDLKIHK